MKSEILLNAIGEIDNKFINKAYNNTQKKKKNIWFKIATVAALIAIVITGSLHLLPYVLPKVKHYNSFELMSQIPISKAEASYVININNEREVAGFADYVFVAKVEAELRTEYENIYVNEVGKVSATPYTYYSITVTDNLKGNLVTGQPIEFYKTGGVNYDKKSISLLPGDCLLESGKYYILAAAGQKDGRLGGFGGGSTEELNITDPNEIFSNEQYLYWKDAVENEIVFDRYRFPSLYE